MVLISTFAASSLNVVPHARTAAVIKNKLNIIDETYDGRKIIVHQSL